jgi:signal transduction histidine kinase
MQNERLIAHQNQMLETRVTERTKDLEQTIHTLQKQREALADANQFKDKVFSVISHDLKSPLSTLGGLLNVLKINNLDENEKEKILNNVQLALKNTRNLLDNILIWATRKRDTKPEGSLFDIYLVVEEIFELFQPQAEAKSLSLINETPSGYLVYGDRNMLQLVLRNLVSNAIKFTKEHGKIWIMIKPEDDDVCILVKDSGIGISPENQKKLFDDNHHFTTRGTNNEKGTGLGLRLCREYIEKQGGTISVESAKDQGTTFKIVLKHAHMPLEKV